MTLDSVVGTEFKMLPLVILGSAKNKLEAKAMASKYIDSCKKEYNKKHGHEPSDKFIKVLSDKLNSYINLLVV